MARYYLYLNHLVDLVVDEEGADFPGLEAAKIEAREVIRAVAAECLESGERFTLRSIRICNDQNDLLAEVTAAEALTEILPKELFISPNSHI